MPRLRHLLLPLLSLALLLVPVAPAQAAGTAAKKFVISGSGAGHGVGMSQYGAFELARTNHFSAEQILTHYYPGTGVGTAVNNPRTVKVQVYGAASDKRTKTTVTVKGGRFTLTDGAGKSWGTFKAGKATLTVKGVKVSAKIGSKKVTAARLIITPTGSAVATISGAQGSYHAGNLQATVIGKRLNVVNQVAMNTDYLYGLDEMPASWGAAGGAAALQAQAIAARNYVITAIFRLPEVQRDASAGMPSCDCHVYDDERSQNYTGWKKAGKSANEPWLSAVGRTISGAYVQVLRDPSAGIAETPYFASTGTGAGTGSNSDVFGTTALSYLVGQDDSYSARAPKNPYLSWKRTITQKRAATIFGVSKIATITVSETYPGGLVKTLTATTTAGATRAITKTAKGWMDALGVPAPWLNGFTAK